LRAGLPRVAAAPLLFGLGLAMPSPLASHFVRAGRRLLLHTSPLSFLHCCPRRFSALTQPSCWRDARAHTLVPVSLSCRRRCATRRWCPCCAARCSRHPRPGPAAQPCRRCRRGLRRRISSPSAPLPVLPGFCPLQWLYAGQAPLLPAPDPGRSPRPPHPPSNSTTGLLPPRPWQSAQAGMEQRRGGAGGGAAVRCVVEKGRSGQRSGRPCCTVAGAEGGAAALSLPWFLACLARLG
jgi:hypothetical protein